MTMHVDDLPVGSAPAALEFPWFPAPYLAVIWRNWNLVGVDRLARVLETGEAEIVAAAALMGLTRDDSLLELWRERGYITVIRRNWHLLDYAQLLALLDWTAEKLEYSLREDDFLWVKLGFLKPAVRPAKYRELTSEERERCRAIAEVARGADLPEPHGEPLFGFLDGFGRDARPVRSSEGLRMIYSYSAPYGDPLLDESDGPFPDALLADYAGAGVNAIWLQGLLYALTPWMGRDNELSNGWEARQQGLRRLVERAGRHGIKVYLYLNEPRALPASGVPEAWRGTLQSDNGLTAFCPQAAGMLDALRDGVAELCRGVPGLGGFFAITMSENLTHCLSRPGDPGHSCPVCTSSSTAARNVVAVLRAIYDGIAAAGGGQQLIAWSWGWQPIQGWSREDLEMVTRELPADIAIMCVSENSLPTEAGGVAGQVNDYSISQVGPGPAARELWELARRHGHKAVAKVQLNTTWELSAVPYIPVPQLVKQHLDNIAACGVDDFLFSWTLGGWPGGNLALANCSIEELIGEKFSGAEVEVVRAITAEFSRAFRLFPFDGCNLIYMGPTNAGPADLLFAETTGYAATMVCFPYDDLRSWRGVYPEEVLEDAFREMSEIWGAAMGQFEMLADTPARRELENIATACYCHWRSSYCQIAFIRRRGAGDCAAAAELVKEEIELAATLYAVQRRDSRIGFEASNHYAYVGADLLEKIINCRWLLQQLRTWKQ